MRTAHVLSRPFTFFPFSPLLFLMLFEDMIALGTLGTESEETENWLVITITGQAQKDMQQFPHTLQTSSRVEWGNVVSNAADRLS